MITDSSVDKDIALVIENIKKNNYDLTPVKNKEITSSILSLIGYVNYLQDRKNYNKTLEKLKEAKYLAELNNDKDSKLIYEYVFGKISKAEKNDKEALMHYKNAERIAYDRDLYNLLSDLTVFATYFSPYKKI